MLEHLVKGCLNGEGSSFRRANELLWLPCRCDGCEGTVNQIQNPGDEKGRPMD